MIDSNFLEYSKLEPLNVSRETFPELEEFRSLILKKNKEINLISCNTEAVGDLACDRIKAATGNRNNSPQLFTGSVFSVGMLF